MGKRDKLTASFAHGLEGCAMCGFGAWRRDGSGVQAWTNEIRDSTGRSEAAGDDAIIGIINVDREGGTSKDAFFMSGEEACIRMQASVKSHRLKPHGWVWDAQPTTFLDNLATNIKADDSNAVDWGSGSICHADTGVGHLSERDEVGANARHATCCT